VPPVRRLLFLGLAIVVSGASVFLTQQWLHGQLRRAAVTARAQAAAAPTSARVLVARQALPAGTILKPQDLRWQAWPADGAAGYLAAPAARPEQLAGAVVRSNLEAGEPLSAARVVQPGDRSFLAAVLRPGYRAITINVSASTGVAGFVLPGDHVDLILSRAVDGGGGGARRFASETLLRDIRVVAMDQRAANDKKEMVVPQTATLEVTPRQAETVLLAGELGKLALALRSLANGPDAPVPADAGGVSDLQASPPIRVAGPPHPRIPRAPTAAAAAVRVVRGAQVAVSGDI
jgi:pilus assembly protein CpaB